jgi:uncharacterized protein (TIGR02246 family)
MLARKLSLVVPLLLAITTSAGAQSGSAAIRESFETFRRTWREAWVRRDVQALGGLATPDLDWVAADGTWLKGRAAFEAHHARIFAQQFQEARWRLIDERVQFVDSTIAITITTTEIQGDTRADGAARPPRRSVGTRVMVRQDGHWRLKVSQNTIVSPPAPAGGGD